MYHAVSYLCKADVHVLICVVIRSLQLDAFRLAAMCCSRITRRSVVIDRLANTCLCRLPSLCRHQLRARPPVSSGDGPASNRWSLVLRRRQSATDRTKTSVTRQRRRLRLRGTRRNCAGRTPSTALAATATSVSSRTVATTCEPSPVIPSTRPTCVALITRPVCARTDPAVTSSTTWRKPDADPRRRRPHRHLSNDAMSMLHCVSWNCASPFLTSINEGSCLCSRHRLVFPRILTRSPPPVSRRPPFLSGTSRWIVGSQFRLLRFSPRRGR